MKFTLTYSGELPPTGNARRPQEKQAIREKFSPQLADLWATHPSLKVAQSGRYLSPTKPFWWSWVHHLADTTAVPSYQRKEGDLDLCESIEIGGFAFLPLVRNNFALVCSLDVLFLRKGATGRVYQGGDLDNRIKTLLDALRVPTKDELVKAPPITAPAETIYCLLEDDALVTGFNVQTRQLLNRPGTGESEVMLVVDVDVRISQPRPYNAVFSGD